MSLEQKKHDEQLHSMAEYDIDSILQAVERIEITEKLTFLKQRIDRKTHFDNFFSNLSDDTNIPDIATSVMKQYFDNLLLDDLFLTLNLGKLFQQLDKFTKLSITTAQDPNDDYISKIWKKMTREHKQRVSLKGYAGGYCVRQGRVIPEHKHDQMHLPKATRFGSKK